MMSGNYRVVILYVHRRRLSSINTVVKFMRKKIFRLKVTETRETFRFYIKLQGQTVRYRFAEESLN